MLKTINQFWEEVQQLKNKYSNENPVTCGMTDQVNHPTHYGGEDNPFEVIKIIEYYDLGFHLGNVLKYILRAGKKDETIQELKKAQWYLERKIKTLEHESI